MNLVQRRREVPLIHTKLHARRFAVSTRPYQIDVSFQDRGWVVENRVLNIMLCGADREKNMEMEENCVMQASKLALHQILLG